MFTKREIATLKSALLVWAMDWETDPCSVSQMRPDLQRVFAEHEPLEGDELTALLDKL